MLQSIKQGIKHLLARKTFKVGQTVLVDNFDNQIGRVVRSYFWPEFGYVHDIQIICDTGENGGQLGKTLVSHSAYVHKINNF